MNQLLTVEAKYLVRQLQFILILWVIKIFSYCQFTLNNIVSFKLHRN